MKLLVYELRESEARAKEEKEARKKAKARREAELARQLAVAKSEAEAAARLNEVAKLQAEAALREEAKRTISVYLRSLELYGADAIDCRRLKMEIDVLGLNKTSGAQTAPPMMSPAITVRSAQANGGEVHLDYRQKIALPPRSAAREALKAALISETLEDSDVFIVLHGVGGAAYGNAGKEMASGMINLEEILAAGNRWPPDTNSDAEP